MHRLRYLFAALLSAGLLAAPYHFPAAWPLTFAALLPLFIAVRRQLPSRAFKLFFLSGFFYYAFIGYWLCRVNVLGFIFLALYLALYWGIFGACARSFLASNQFRSTITVAALWTLLEYIRGWMLSGFPWALLSYSQWKNLPFIQIAEFIGAYGVSFLLAWANAVLARFFVRLPPACRTGRDGRSSFDARAALTVALVMAMVWGYGFASLRSREAFYNDGRPKAAIRVSVLQGNIPQEEKWDARIKSIILEKYKRLTLMASMEKPDLIVWPETSFPGYLEDEALMAAHLRQTVRESKTSALVGAPTIGDLEKESAVRFYNSAVLYGSDGEERDRYSKVHLVPFGEYVPFEALIGFIRNFVSIGHFSPGAKQTLFSIVSQGPTGRIAAKFGVLICYEDIFPGLVRGLTVDGADFLVNITNDAWFGKTAAPYQHAQASVFRAIENRVPVVRAANTGLSCFITAEGRLAASVMKDGEEIMVSGYRSHDLILRRGRSFFTKYGDFFFWLTLGWVLFAYRQRHKQSGYSPV